MGIRVVQAKSTGALTVKRESEVLATVLLERRSFGPLEGTWSWIVRDHRDARIGSFTDKADARAWALEYASKQPEAQP